jgi:GntR family transcriptional regulator
MAQQQVAGAIILDQLRDRIVTGLYLGRWEPGERLPSIRDVAGVENVDRKTAAAAYRRLQQEGLVRVRPRSGVYLRDNGVAGRGGPLERLHRRWLENVYDGAHDLGLDTHAILRLVTAVAETEQRRVPVVDEDWSQAEAVAAELRSRLSLHAVPYLLDEVRGDEAVQRDAPFIITTPYHRSELSSFARVPVIETTLDRQAFKKLQAEAGDGPVLIIAPTELVATRIRRAIDQGQLLGANAPASVVVATEREQLRTAAAGTGCIFLWPGTPPWVANEFKDLPCIAPVQTLADSTLARVRRAVLEGAIRKVVESGGLEGVSSTSGDGARATSAAAAQ